MGGAYSCFRRMSRVFHEKNVHLECLRCSFELIRHLHLTLHKFCSISFPLHVHDTHQKPLHVKPSRFTSPRKKRTNRRGMTTTETSNLLRITALPSLNTKISPKISVELEFVPIRPPPWPAPQPPRSPPLSLPVIGAASAVVSIDRRWRFRGSGGFQL